MLRMGYGETDITPTKCLELVGFNRRNALSEGILGPLKAQISVWEGEMRCCLITIDSLGFTKKLADTLRRKAANTLNVSKDEVMLCFSHTHAAPNAEAYPAYFEMVCVNVLTALIEARQNIQTVRAGCMNAEVDIGVNRRAREDEVDKRAGVLKVCDADGKIKLLIVRVSAHCNVLKRDNLCISPDYFGAIRDRFGKEYHCPVMVIQGASGNVAPKFFDSNLTPSDASGTEYVRSKTALLDMADTVYKRIESGIEKLETKDPDFITMYTKEIEFCSHVPAMKTAAEIAEEAKRICSIDASEWLREIQRLHKLGIKRQYEKAEVQYFAIDKFCLCGVPYEIMTEFSLEAMKKTGNMFFYINGYTNGCLSYFPTAEAFDEGGYEVYYAMLLYFKYYNRVFPFERDSAEKLSAFMIENAPDYSDAYSS